MSNGQSDRNLKQVSEFGDVLSEYNSFGSFSTGEGCRIFLSPSFNIAISNSGKQHALVSGSEDGIVPWYLLLECNMMDMRRGDH